MNVYDKLVMGPDAGNLEGAIEKKWFKQILENQEFVLQYLFQLFSLYF